MDSLYLCIALGPLAVYLVALGIVNLSRRPTLVSGGRDLAALGLAMGGLAFAGPMQLFFPEHAAARYGPVVWGLLIVFYIMSVSLFSLLARPRMVVYNISTAELRPILADLAQRLDSQAVWAEDSLALPQLEVRLHLESFPAMRNVSLLAHHLGQLH